MHVVRTSKFLTGTTWLMYSKETLIWISDMKWLQYGCDFSLDLTSDSHFITIFEVSVAVELQFQAIIGGDRVTFDSGRCDVGHRK